MLSRWRQRMLFLICHSAVCCNMGVCCLLQYGCVHLSKQQQFLLARLWFMVLLMLVPPGFAAVILLDCLRVVIDSSSNRLVTIQLPSQVKAYSLQLGALSYIKRFCTAPCRSFCHNSQRVWILNLGESGSSPSSCMRIPVQLPSNSHEEPVSQVSRLS